MEDQEKRAVRVTLEFVLDQDAPAWAERSIEDRVQEFIRNYSDRDGVSKITHQTEKIQPPVKVGAGATQYVGSDRYPYTVVKVLSPRRIQVQRDQFRRTDRNGLSESQEYDYTLDPDGRVLTLTLRKDGRWVEEGQSLKSQGFGIGYRRAYQDPSF